MFGTIDTVQAQYVTACLENAGMRPFLFSPRANPGSGMIDGWVKGGMRNVRNHPANELKVLVPFAEVLKAAELPVEPNIQEE